MSDYYFAKGIIRYNKDWVIIECPHDVINYYKFWVEKFIGKKISTSLHRPHITVVAGKYDKGCDKHPLWRKYDGKELEFKYNSEIFTDSKFLTLGGYFWLRVTCPIIPVLRTELGLNPYLFHHPHLTIGYRGN
jgi:hypothetical protein